MVSPLARKMNSGSPERWEADRIRARDDMIFWLAENAESSQLRIDLENKSLLAIQLLEKNLSIRESISTFPESLTVIRALTRRDIGTSQFATFTGFGESIIRRIEGGVNAPSEFIEKATLILESELDYALVPWLQERRTATVEERNRSVYVSADRILRRTTSTALRYQHEPRQLEKLESFLIAQGLKKHDFTTLVDPLVDVIPGTYSFRVNVNGKTSEDLILKQNVDVLIKPFSYAADALPIFMEAKSMSDEVNPNKRQKEEAQKINNLIRMWGTKSTSDIIYLLLLGGTVPRRYLEVEAGSGIDWIWEHRVEDLKLLLD